MNWQETIDLLADRSRFPHIPRDLIRLMNRSHAEGQASPIMNALARDPHDVAAAINRMFEIAVSYTTDLTADDLLHLTDFNRHDIDPTRIEAAFAEIRAINFLGAQGFTNINLLRSGCAKSADILADRDSTRYAIEVANSIYCAGGRPAPEQLSFRTLGSSDRYTPEQLKDWIVGRLRSGKETQLLNTATQPGALRRVFIGIVDTEEPVIFQTHAGFASACRLAWEAVGADTQFHVALVTGRVTLGYGPDDAVYPNWP